MDDFKELGKEFYPPNTAADTRKCIGLFQDWAMDRNVRQVPNDVLTTDNHPNPLSLVVQILHRNTSGSWYSLSSVFCLDDNFSDIDIKDFQKLCEHYSLYSLPSTFNCALLCCVYFTFAMLIDHTILWLCRLVIMTC